MCLSWIVFFFLSTTTGSNYRWTRGWERGKLPRNSHRSMSRLSWWKQLLLSPPLVAAPLPLPLSSITCARVEGAPALIAATGERERQGERGREVNEIAIAWARNCVPVRSSTSVLMESWRRSLKWIKCGQEEYIFHPSTSTCVSPLLRERGENGSARERDTHSHTDRERSEADIEAPVFHVATIQMSATLTGTCHEWQKREHNCTHTQRERRWNDMRPRERAFKDTIETQTLWRHLFCTTINDTGARWRCDNDSLVHP